MTRERSNSSSQREVMPKIERHFADESFPSNSFPNGRTRIFGANLKGYGCAGMNNVAYGLIMQELEAADSGLRSFASVQSALSMYAIYAWGSEEQKQRYLPGMAKGKIDRMLRPDRTRPRLRPGRDGDARATRRRRMDSQRHQAMDHQRFDRRRRDGVGEGREGITGFMVEKGTPGLHHPRHPRQVLDARVDHLGADFRGRRIPKPTAQLRQRAG